MTVVALVPVRCHRDRSAHSFTDKMGCAQSTTTHTLDVVEQISGNTLAAETTKSSGKVCNGKMVLGKYDIDGFLGEGNFSICHRGTDTKTGQEVALKEYKRQSKQIDECNQIGGEENEMDIRFRNQIKTLQELQNAFNPDCFAGAGKSRILESNPANMYARLLDFSPSECVERYIVSEMGCPLQFILEKHKASKVPIRQHRIRHISQAIVLAVGGLHEKGLVHLDVKPESVMLFGNHWKLTDFDGCMRIGEHISCADNMLTFSPCYSAPELAAFVMSNDRRTTLKADASLDSWSVGMTLAELVSLEPLLLPVFDRILRETGLQAGETVMMKFLKQLGRMLEVPVPRCLDKFDANFASIIRFGLLALIPRQRLTMANCLEEDFMRPFEKPTAQKTSFKFRVVADTYNR